MHPGKKWRTVLWLNPNILVESDEFKNLYSTHSIDSDIFYVVIYLPAPSKTYINLYFLKHCQIAGNLFFHISTSCMMTLRWRGVTRDRDKKVYIVISLIVSLMRCYSSNNYDRA